MFKKKIEKGKKITALIVSLILLFIFSFNLNNVTTEGNKDDNNKLKISALTLPIYIDDLGGGDYTWEEAVSEDWCSGSGTDVEPYLLENLIIDGGGTDSCITIENSKAHFVIKNCTVYNGGGFWKAGIFLFNVTNGILIENNCSNNGQDGIVLWAWSYGNTISSNIITSNGQTGMYGQDCNNSTISNNKISNNRYGIVLEWSLFNEILENIVYKNQYNGIHLSNSHNNTILENMVYNNSENGATLFICELNNLTSNSFYNNTENGIYFEDSYNNNMWNNDLYQNKMNGIVMETSDDNEAYNNVIRDNSDRGVDIYPDSADNLFYENFFHRNGRHAVDEASNSDWNSTKIGNYWDNYTGTDTSPKDGIGDVPHDFGTGIDYLPIVDDASPVITINTPNAGDAFDDAPSFELTIDEDYLWDMWYTLDGGVNNYFTDFTETIDQAAWDVFSDGNITLTFYANDKAENVGSTEVIVSKDTQAPVIVIIKPVADKKFSSAFNFELEVTDPHLDTIWYSFDGGVTNFTAATPSEKIEKAAWSAVAKGDVTITFYASDTLGHVTSESVIIKKVEPTIGLDYVTTSILILAISGVAIISIITKIHSKKRIIHY